MRTHSGMQKIHGWQRLHKNHGVDFQTECVCLMWQQLQQQQRVQQQTRGQGCLQLLQPTELRLFRWALQLHSLSP